MVRLNTILLPTDGSKCSGKAARYAFSLAKQYGAKVVTLTVIDERWSAELNTVVVNMQENIGEQIRSNLEAQARSLLASVVEKGREAGVAVEARSAHGTPHDVILSVAKEVGADLIIMGTHGVGGLSHLLLGSVTEKVIRSAPCAVLTVREEEE